MRALNKWTRIIHRWLSALLLVAIVILIVYSARGENSSTPAWVTAIAIGTLISMILTGTYLFALHYISKLRRAARVRRSATNFDSNSTEA